MRIIGVVTLDAPAIALAHDGVPLLGINRGRLGFLTDIMPNDMFPSIDAALQDADYDPPFSDFNVVIDNHGAAVNVTVPKATARIKFRYSAKVDPAPVLEAVHDAAARFDIAVSEAREGFPPELPANHPLVRLCIDVTGKPPATAPYGTDASELQAIAPCVVLGPGDIGEAHTPTEKARVADLVAAVPLFMTLAERSAAG